MALVVAALFLCLQAGQGMGDNASSALFFLRFGVGFLPYMYILLGGATLALTLGYTAGLGRIARRRFFRGLTAGLIVVLLLERAALVKPFALLYPVLWLTINCMGMIIGTFSWNIAADISDARQAKRLFPLFTSAVILGGVLGNSLTGLIARYLGTENLLLLYAVLLGICYVLIARLGDKYLQSSIARGTASNLVADLRSGLDFVRRSPLMTLMAYAAVLFSVMYFSLAYPFSKVVTASFSDEAGVAGFLGLFTGVTTAVTFLVSLVIANRIYTRVGIVNSVLILPVVYAIGFVVFAGHYSLVGGIVARFSQLVVLSGIASSAYSALFNVVPSQKRGQVLAFENGVPSQIGVALSGILLALGDRIMRPAEILFMGLIATAVCGFIVWRMRAAYGQALVDALRSGRLEVFGADQVGFAGLRGDAAALAIATGALQDRRVETRRIAAEILGAMQNPAATAELKRRVQDSDAGVRAAVISALGRLGAAEACEEIISALTDRDGQVRLRALAALGGLDEAIVGALGPRLVQMLEDESFEVRREALATLARLHLPIARDQLKSWLDSDDPRLRLAALESFGRVVAHFHPRLDPAPVVLALKDASIAARVAACRGLSGLGDRAVVEALAGALSDRETAVRRAAAASLEACGPEAHEQILHVVESGDEAASDAALGALSPGSEPTSPRLRQFAHAEIARLRGLRRQISSLPGDGRATHFLKESLQERLGRGEVRLVKIVGLIGQATAMEWVQKQVLGPDSQARAAALEALETLGDKVLARGIIGLLEEAPEREAPSAALSAIMDGGDRWLRALAARSAYELGLKDLWPRLERMRSDPDELVRETAMVTLGQPEEEISMNTLKTISTLERVLLLREVPIFSELSPEDLERVAEIAREEWYPADAAVCRQGDEGSTMYIIVDGNLRVIRSLDGEDRVLATRSRGDFVGEMAIIDSAPRSATLLTDGEVRVLAIDGGTLKEILRERPEVALSMLRSFSRRLRDTNG